MKKGKINRRGLSAFMALVMMLATVFPTWADEGGGFDDPSDSGGYEDQLDTGEGGDESGDGSDAEDNGDEPGAEEGDELAGPEDGGTLPNPPGEGNVPSADEGGLITVFDALGGGYDDVVQLPSGTAISDMDTFRLGLLLDVPNLTATVVRENGDEETITIPVLDWNWTSDDEITFVFTPTLDLPEGVSIADGVNLPTVTMVMTDVDPAVGALANATGLRSTIQSFGFTVSEPEGNDTIGYTIKVSGIINTTVLPTLILDIDHGVTVEWGYDGNVANLTSTASAVLALSGNGTFKLVNGKVDTGSRDVACTAISASGDVYVEITAGQVLATTSYGAPIAIAATGSSKIIMSGGVVTATKTDQSSDPIAIQLNSADAAVTISGGTVAAIKTSNADGGGASAISAGVGNYPVVITGGTVYAANDATDATFARAISATNRDVEISGGKVYVDIDGSSTAVNVDAIQTTGGKVLVFGGEVYVKGSGNDTDAEDISVIQTTGGEVTVSGIGKVYVYAEATTSASAIDAILTDSGNVNVSDNAAVYTIVANTASRAADVDAIHTTSGVVTVSGGTVTATVSNTINGSSYVDAIHTGNGDVNVSNGIISAVRASTATNTNARAVYSASGNVAISETDETLLTAPGNGSTADTTGTVFAGIGTVTMSGGTVEATEAGGIAIRTAGPNGTVSVSGGEVTANAAAGKGIYTIGNNAVVTVSGIGTNVLSDVTGATATDITGTNYGIQTTGTSATVSVSDGAKISATKTLQGAIAAPHTLSVTNYGIYTNGTAAQVSVSDGASVSVSTDKNENHASATITGSSVNYGVYTNNGANVLVDSGTVSATKNVTATGENAGVYVNGGGTITVSGTSTITSTITGNEATIGNVYGIIASNTNGDTGAIQVNGTSTVVTASTNGVGDVWGVYSRARGTTAPTNTGDITVGGTINASTTGTGDVWGIHADVYAVTSGTGTTSGNVATGMITVSGTVTAAAVSGYVYGIESNALTSNTTSNSGIAVTGAIAVNGTVTATNTGSNVAYGINAVAYSDRGTGSSGTATVGAITTGDDSAVRASNSGTSNNVYGIYAKAYSETSTTFISEMTVKGEVTATATAASSKAEGISAYDAASAGLITVDGGTVTAMTSGLYANGIITTGNAITAVKLLNSSAVNATSTTTAYGIYAERGDVVAYGGANKTSAPTVSWDSTAFEGGSVITVSAISGQAIYAESGNVDTAYSKLTSPGDGATYGTIWASGYVDVAHSYIESVNLDSDGIVAGSYVNANESEILAADYGIYTSSGAVTVTNSGIYTNNEDGIHAQAGDVTVSGSVIESDHYAIHAVSGAVDVSGTSIDSDGYGIYTSNGAVTVANSTIAAIEDGIHAQSGNITVTGDSEIVSTSHYAIHAVAGTVTVVSNGGNSIITASDSAILASGAVSVSGAAIDSTGRYGIYSTNGGVTVTSSAIHAAEDGVHAQAGNVRVSGDSQIESDHYGIHAVNGTVIVISNEGTSAITASRSGILASSTVNVSGCAIDAGNYGIYTTSGAVTVTNSSIIAVEDGINARNAVNVSGSEIESADYGIYATGGAVTVASSTIAAIEDGIHAQTNNVTVSGDSVIESTNHYGIHAVAGAVTVISNEGGSMITASDSGILANGAVSVSGASIESGRYGIYTTTGGVTITNSGIYADEDGIHAENGNVRVSVGSEIVSLSDYGIHAVNGAATLLDSTITSGAIGIFARNDINVSGSAIDAEEIGIQNNNGTTTTINITNSAVIANGNRAINAVSSNVNVEGADSLIRANNTSGTAIYVTSNSAVRIIGGSVEVNPSGTAIYAHNSVAAYLAGTCPVDTRGTDYFRLGGYGMIVEADRYPGIYIRRDGTTEGLTTRKVSSGYTVAWDFDQVIGSPAAIQFSTSGAFNPLLDWGHVIENPYVGGGSIGGGGGGGGGTVIVVPDVPEANGIVDGKAIEAGDVKTSGDTSTLTVNQEIIEKQLETASDHVIVIIPSDTSTAVAQLVVKNVEDMAAKDMILAVQVGNVLYELPTTAVDTAAILTELDAANAADVLFNISVTTDMGEAAEAAANNAVKINGNTLIIAPMEFTVTATYNGKTVEVDVFSQYVSRSLEVTEEQARQITTALVIEPDGTTRHVPTRVYQQGGKWYVEINCLTNSTYVVVYNEKTFSDAEGKWYEDAVNEMASRMVIAGVGSNTFAGDRDITRAEFASIVVKALGLPATGKATAFRDVSASSWYSGAVGTAYEYGLIAGIGGDMFAPERKITREEAMVIMQKAAKVAGLTGSTGNIGSFADAGKVSDWAYGAAQWNVGSGLIVGSNGKLNSDQNITRAETATIALKLVQKAGLVDVRTRF